MIAALLKERSVTEVLRYSKIKENFSILQIEFKINIVDLKISKHAHKANNEKLQELRNLFQASRLVSFTSFQNLFFSFKQIYI